MGKMLHRSMSNLCSPSLHLHTHHCVVGKERITCVLREVQIEVQCFCRIVFEYIVEKILDTQSGITLTHVGSTRCCKQLSDQANDNHLDFNALEIFFPPAKIRH